jgi:hypothetical protein
LPALLELSVFLRSRRSFIPVNLCYLTSGSIGGTLNHAAMEACYGHDLYRIGWICVSDQCFGGNYWRFVRKEPLMTQGRYLPL